MQPNQMSGIEEVRQTLLDAARMHVVFDGWSAKTIELARKDTGIEESMIRLAFPRGALDLAIYFHETGDNSLADLMEKTDMSAMRIREKVTFGVIKRLEIAYPDREAVRRGVTFFALPQNSAQGAKCIWNTADTIWNGIGDTSRDINWYTKRATLSAVYSSSVLYWLGDESDNFEKSREFVDRRIENVMQFEKFKANAQSNPLAKAFMAGPGRLLDLIKAPSSDSVDGLPGKWRMR
jgi:ubiquinone biosynthesis protein COQ9